MFMYYCPFCGNKVAENSLVEAAWLDSTVVVAPEKINYAVPALYDMNGRAVTAVSVVGKVGVGAHQKPEGVVVHRYCLHVLNSVTQDNISENAFANKPFWKWLMGAHLSSALLDEVGYGQNRKFMESQFGYVHEEDAKGGGKVSIPEFLRDPLKSKRNANRIKKIVQKIVAKWNKEVQTVGSAPKKQRANTKKADLTKLKNVLSEVVGNKQAMCVIGSDNCSYTRSAKELLREYVRQHWKKNRNVSQTYMFRYHSVNSLPFDSIAPAVFNIATKLPGWGRRTKRPDHKTIPIVFWRGKFIGGYSELVDKLES